MPRVAFLVTLAGMIALTPVVAQQTGSSGAGAETNSAARSPEVAQRYAHQLIVQGKTESAMRIVDEALAAHPRDPGLLGTKGAIQRRTGDLAAACATYETMFEIQPDDDTTRNVLALLLSERAAQEKPPAALPLLKRSLALSGDTGIALRLAAAAAATGDIPVLGSALTAAAPALQTPDAIPTLLAAGSACLRANAAATALFCFQTVLGMTPDDSTAVNGLLEVSTKPDTRNAARQAAEALLRRHPDNLNILMLHARLSTGTGTSWAAIHSLSKVLAREPANALALSLRTEQLLEAGCLAPAWKAVSLPGFANEPLRTRILAAWAAQEKEWARQDQAQAGKTLPAWTVITYGRISRSPEPGATDIATLRTHLDYLLWKGCTFVGPRDIAAARRGKRPLPPASLMLVFTVNSVPLAELLPVLDAYGVPATLAVASSRVGSGAPGEPDWNSLRAAVAWPGITLASMTHAMEGTVLANPQGRMLPAAAARIYDASLGAYESEAQYRERLDADLKASRLAIQKNTGFMTDVLVWPHGRYTRIAAEVAANLGFDVMMMERSHDLPGAAAEVIGYRPVPSGSGLDPLLKTVYAVDPAAPARTFAMPLNLDRISAGSPAETAANLDAAIARIAAAGASIVHVTGTSDPDGNGTADALFFPSRSLPVKSDLLGQACGLLRDRNITVYVRMPALAYAVAATNREEISYVMEYRWGRIRPSDYLPRRLSPFDKRNRDLLVRVYEDLAACVEFDGIVLGDDAQLTEREDFCAAAVRAYDSELGIHERNPERFNPQQREEWTRAKSARLDQVIDSLKSSVLKSRPEARFSRTLSPLTLARAGTAAELAREFNIAATQSDDAVVPVAADTTPTDRSHDRWIQDLVRAAAASPQGLSRTVFRVEVRTDDNRSMFSRSPWIADMKALSDAGAQHVVYGSDIPSIDWPPLRQLQQAKEWFTATSH